MPEPGRVLSREQVEAMVASTERIVKRKATPESTISFFALARSHEQLREVLRDLFDYTCEVEGRYGAQVAVRSYLSFPEGGPELGNRVRAALSAGEETP